MTSGLISETAWCPCHTGPKRLKLQQCIYQLGKPGITKEFSESGKFIEISRNFHRNRHQSGKLSFSSSKRQQKTSVVNTCADDPAYKLAKSFSEVLVFKTPRNNATPHLPWGLCSIFCAPSEFPALTKHLKNREKKLMNKARLLCAYAARRIKSYIFRIIFRHFCP